MTQVLVTGGTGVLGRELVPILKADGYTVRVMSRRPASSNPWPEVEWAQADLENGGLAEAVSNVDIVIHAATDNAFTPQGVRLRSAFFPKRQVDVRGTERMLQEAIRAKVAHFLYPSIVGIERVPLAYYRHKLQAEGLVQQGGIPWSILRATQFHNLIDSVLQSVLRWPFFLIPTDFVFQPVAVSEVAERLLEIIASAPTGRLDDIGGPKVLTLGQLARGWLQARGLKRRVVHLPTLGKAATGVRRGYLTSPQEKYGRLTWEEWLNRKYQHMKSKNFMNPQDRDES